MNNLFKKSVAVIASMGVLATTVNVNAFAASLVNAEFTAAYEWMKEANATTMPTEEAFLPYNNVTREQAPKMMINGLMAGGVELKKVRDYNLDFSDLTSADPSLQADIIKGYEYGLVNGWNGEYHPRDVVNRAQVMTILGRALYGQLPESAEYWKNYYKLLNTEGIFTIENAQAPIKRYELALVLYRVANLDRTANNETVDQLLCEVLGKEDCKKDDKKDDTDTNTSPVVVNGTADISVVSVPATQNVPYNASTVNVGTVKITAGNNGATVQSLAVSRSGLGDAAGIDKIFVGKNGIAISDGDFYNPVSQIGTIYFSPALNLAANQSVEFDVYVTMKDPTTADVSKNQNSLHAFTATEISVSNGTGYGVPATLGSVQTTSYGVSKLTSTLMQGSAQLQPGKSNQSIAKLQLEAGEKSLKLDSFAITRASGSADFVKRLTNVKVYKNGAQVGKAMVTADKIAVTEIDNIINDGTTNTYEIRADVLIDSNESPLKMKLNASDVYATEIDTNYVARVNVGNTEPVSSTFSNVYLTFKKLSSGNETVAPGTSNIKLFEGKVESSVNVFVKKLTVKKTDNANGTVDNFTNNQLKVKVNNATVGIIDQDTLESFEVSFPVTANTPATIVVEGSARSTAAGTYQYDVTLAEMRDASNNTIANTTFNRIGDTTTIEAGTIKVKAATVAAPSSKIIYSNASDLEIGRFALESKAETVTVRTMKLTKEGTFAANLSDALSSVKLVNAANGEEISSVVTINNGNIEFDSMSLAVEKDKPLNVKVVAQTNNLSVNNTQTLKFTATVEKANRQSGGAEISDTTGVSTKEYIVGVRPPLVTGKKVSDDKFLITVENVDSETDITLDKVSLRILPAQSQNGLFEQKFCVRAQGASTNCPGNLEADGTPKTGKGDSDFSLAAIPGNTITKNNGTVTFEVFVDSNVQIPNNLELQVRKLTWDGGNTSEDYMISVK